MVQTRAQKKKIEETKSEEPNKKAEVKKKAEPKKKVEPEKKAEPKEKAEPEKKKTKYNSVITDTKTLLMLLKRPCKYPDQMEKV